ncbi:hypothetical protein D3C71_2088580 [compost metagenome]
MLFVFRHLQHMRNGNEDIASFTHDGNYLGQCLDRTLQIAAFTAASVLQNDGSFARVCHNIISDL